MTTLNIPETGIKYFAAAIAKEHRVVYISNPLDDLSITLANLSGDTVYPDETLDLLIALKRSGVIDGPTAILLCHRHLEETFNV